MKINNDNILDSEFNLDVKQSVFCIELQKRNKVSLKIKEHNFVIHRKDVICNIISESYLAFYLRF